MSSPTTWRFATVTGVRRLGPRGVAVRLDVPDRVDHLPGQHYVLRLTADDGYIAQRSYSLASSPTEPFVELGVHVLPDGEVSGFLADVLRPGDQLEVRGPIGGYFVWDGSGPVLGIGGGSGVVPFVAMARFAAAAQGVDADLLRLAVAARTRDDLLYVDELTAAGATIAYSRSERPPMPDRPGLPERAGRAAGRLSADDLAPLLRDDQQVLVCGSAAFAEGVSELLLELGVAPGRVKVERFGPTGS